jgi:lipase maturation factor 1
MNDLETNVRPEHKVSSYDSAQYLFLKALGAIYVIAFLSFGLQVTGLIGQHGILPLATFLRRVREVTGGPAWHLVPTIFWLDSTDGFLKLVCFLGIVAAGFVIAGKGWRVALVFCYLLYLSLVHAGQDFMSYQWDMLLLETGFLAIFLGWHPFVSSMFRWLLFRLMFLSGIAKLTSGDPTWRNLSALRYHYETQPLPTPLAWYAHQLPLGFHRATAAAMFAIELLVPLLLFLPRRVRMTAGFGIALLQVVILLTGNYTFFNWLTLALCLFSMDDSALRPWIPQWVAKRIRPPRKARIGRPIAVAAIAVVLTLTFVLIVSAGAGRTWRPTTAIVRAFAPFGIANNYGLFAVMTTTRDEIIVEGSSDGKNWQIYEFRYKPGDTYRAPLIIAPFQPRLDWQMWFAALGTYRNNPWFVNFAVRLLQGAPEVTGLLKKNPFPTTPPKYVRAEMYRYWFTDFKTGNKTGAWWYRMPRGTYMRAISLDDVRIEAVTLRPMLTAQFPAQPRAGQP